MDIREMKQDDTLERMLPVIPLRVNDFYRIIKNMWYQDEICLEEHRLVGPYQFGSTERKKFKYSNTIEKK